MIVLHTVTIAIGWDLAAEIYCTCVEFGIAAVAGSVLPKLVGRF